VRTGLLLALPVLLSLGTGACRPRPTRDHAAAGARAVESAATHRARGLVALDAGQFHLARAAFAASLAAAPDNLATRVLLDAATRALLASQQAAADAFAAARPTVLLAPPAQAAVIREAPVTPAAPPLSSCSCASTTAPAPTTPPGCATTTPNCRSSRSRTRCAASPAICRRGSRRCSARTCSCRRSPGRTHTLLFYGPDYRGGRFIAVLAAAGERLGFFDLTAYELPATWAEVVDGVLLVTLGDDDGAYVVALELTTGALLWRSDPGLASAANFVVDGAHLLTARGGASPAVFVLDRRTGAALTSHPLAGEPAYLLVHARRLSVRTDVADHEFELGPE
jgi:hypothetical protein